MQSSRFELHELGAELDRTDRRILKLLQDDATLSNVALAERVNLSPAACLQRVEKLKRERVIRRVVAHLDPKQLQTGMVVLIGVVLDRSAGQVEQLLGGAI